MIGKKINQLATELAPTTTDLTIIGDPVTGVSKKITLEQLGAIFGGAVSFYTTLGDFPATGVIDIIYCAKDTKKLYLWSGSAYVEVFPSQSLLDTYQLRSEKGVSNGYASLDVNGKVPIGQLPNSIMEYKGTWNAATNTPTLANGTGDTGDVYICNAAGTVNFGAGPITFAVGDYVVYSGTIWQRSSGAVGTVTSVGLSITGDSIGVTGSPITTSGTLALAFAGTGAQYIKGDGTLATFPSIISQAQNLVTEVYNNTGATLSKGTIVYINGGQGNLPTVTKALAIGDSTSAQTYGVVQTDITNMNNGYVVVAGRLTDLDTQAYSNGTQLYLSATTAGTWTSTKQYAPNHLVYVGIVVRSHPTQGVVEIKIQNGYELDELHNVAAQSPDNNDILQYKTATSLWTKVAGTTTNIAEGTNLYYTDARSRAALSFTAGSGAYNSTTGVITIPTNTNQLTNGAAFITLASLSAGAGISYNNTTGVIASTITQYTDALARAAISLTTTGTSGAATYNNTTGVLNIPQYQTALTNPVTGTGTTNYLPKFTGTSTIGNSIVSESGSIITIAGSLYSSGTLRLTGSSSVDFQAYTGSAYSNLNYDAASHNWQTSGGTAKMILNASGNLGLGVTPSAWGSSFRAFEILGGSIFSTSTQNIIYLQNAYNDGTGFKYITSDTASQYRQANGEHRWFNAPSGTAGNAISFTQAMTLNASGNLSVGNTNDTYKLDVSGTGRFTGNVLISKSTDASVEVNSTSNLSYSAFYHSENGTPKAYWEYINSNFSTTSRRNYLEAYNLVGGFAIYTANAKALDIASTGAATFSSSVTAQGTGLQPIIHAKGGGDAAGQGKGNFRSSDAGGTNYFDFGRDNLTTGNFVLTSGGGSPLLSITTTGAATFSSTIGSAGDITITKSSAASFIANNTSASGKSFRLVSKDDGNFTIQQTGISDLVTITSGGNVGIGTTSPSRKLQVYGTASVFEGILVENSTSNAYALYQSKTGNSNLWQFGTWNDNSFRIGTSGVGDFLTLASTGAATFSSTIQTGAPTNGTAQPWRLGDARSGSISTNSYIIVSVNGTTYSIPALNGLP